MLAVSFALVYHSTRIFHVAIGGIYALVPYVALHATTAGWALGAAIALSVGVGVVVSVAMEVLNHRPLSRRESQPIGHLLTSLGMYMVLVQVCSIMWGSNPQVLRRGLDEVVQLGDQIITRTQLTSALIGLAVLAMVAIWLRRSQTGLKLRALADNPIQFELLGLSRSRYRAIAFGLSGGLCALSALITAYDLGFDPYTGLHAALLSAVAVIFGGRSLILGPLIGGIVLGVVRAEVVWYTSARWEDAATFLLLAVILVFRPSGLFGPKLRLEAAE